MKPSKRILINASLLALSIAAFASPGAPKPSAELMAAAAKDSKASKKAILVVFGASWCPWCHKLDALMESKEYSKLFTDNYVVVHLEVMERGEKKSLANPGADKLLADLGGAKSGLPFFAVLDSGGKKLADANAMPGGQNIGFPSEPQEIAAFEEILKKTAPRLSADSRSELVEHLKRLAKR